MTREFRCEFTWNTRDANLKGCAYANGETLFDGEGSFSQTSFIPSCYTQGGLRKVAEEYEVSSERQFLLDRIDPSSTDNKVIAYYKERIVVKEQVEKAFIGQETDVKFSPEMAQGVFLDATIHKETDDGTQTDTRSGDQGGSADRTVEPGPGEDQGT